MNIPAQVSGADLPTFLWGLCLPVELLGHSARWRVCVPRWKRCCHFARAALPTPSMRITQKLSDELGLQEGKGHAQPGRRKRAVENLQELSGQPRRNESQILHPETVSSARLGPCPSLSHPLQPGAWGHLIGRLPLLHRVGRWLTALSGVRPVLRISTRPRHRRVCGQTDGICPRHQRAGLSSTWPPAPGCLGKRPGASQEELSVKVPCGRGKHLQVFVINGLLPFHHYCEVFTGQMQENTRSAFREARRPAGACGGE